MIEILKYIALFIFSIFASKEIFEALSDKPDIFLFLTIVAIPLTILINLKKSLLIFNKRKIRMGLFLIANLVYLLLIGHFLNNNQFIFLAFTCLLLTVSLARIYIENSSKLWLEM